MLVHHLRHIRAARICARQENHVLIEGFDQSLQLDAIDEKNGHSNALPAELIQERVLEQLAFVAHDMNSWEIKSVGVLTERLYYLQTTVKNKKCQRSCY